MLAIHGFRYQFDMADRLEGASGLTTYRYDASGRRVQKVEIDNSETLDSDYSRAGQLMYQWNPAGASATDYIYLGDTLVARVVASNSEVTGAITAVSSGSSAAVTGWACSTGVSSAVGVQLYVNEPPTEGGILIATATADQASGSESACDTTDTNYGFSIPLTAAIRSQYPNAPLYAYGISPVGNPNGELSGSGSFTVPVNPSAPPAPASITVPATSSTGSFGVSWASSTGATSYVLQQTNTALTDPVTWTQIYSGAATSFNVTGLGTGNFQYQVQACNANGCSTFTTSSVVEVAIIPAAPTSISVPSSSYSPLIAVSWSGSAGANNYVLEESFNGGAWGEAWSGNATSTTVTVSASGSYQFQVAACAAGGCSTFTASSAVSVTLPPASAPGLSASTTSSSTGTFTLSWNTVTGATSYQLSQNIGGTVSVVYSGAGTSWSASGLGNGVYAYQVVACNAAGCGPASAAVTVTVLHVPAAPSYMTAPSRVPYPGNPWSLAINPVSTATSYNLQRTNLGSTGSPTTVMTNVGTNPTDYTTPGTYQYAAQACNASGCSGWTNAGNTTVVFCAESAVRRDIMKCGSAVAATPRGRPR